ncbi:MAG: TonB-dependent receptor [Bacteroidota bacterium]
MKHFSRSLQKVTLILVVVLTASGTLLAQGKGTISGVITDPQTGETMIGAHVVVEGTSHNTITDPEGRFILTNIPAGDYLLKISYIGYEDKQVGVGVAAGGITDLKIEIVYSGFEMDEVVVTAQARGQLKAINNQLNAQDIRNVVSAERIQELPDANAAETLGRLPGVSIKRVGGEGNKVVVRGLSPKYSKITLEGISMAASGSDRSSDISMISPYSLDGIEVIKAATADKDADFIGGLVNFKLRDADPGWRSDLVVQGGYNNLKSTFSDYMLTGNVSNRFFDDKLGVYLQGNIEQRNRSANTLSADYNVEAGISDPIVGEENQVFTTSFSMADIIRKRSRYGSTLVMDYRLKGGSFHFKNFYSQSGTEIDRYTEGYTVAAPSPVKYTGKREAYDLQTYSNILNYEQRFNNLKIDAKASHSFSKSTTPQNIGFYFSQRDGMFLPEENDIRRGSLPPHQLLQYKTINDTIAEFDKLDENYSITEERQLEASLDLQYDFAISTQVNGHIKAGGKYRYKERFHDRTAYGSNLNLGHGANNTMLDAYPWMRDTMVAYYGGSPEDYVDFAENLIYPLFMDREFDHRNYLDGKYYMGPVPDLDLLEGALGAIQDNQDALNDVSYAYYNRASRTYDYSGSEYFYAGYILSEINFGKHLKFIPGVRYEHNRTIYTATRGWFATSDREFNEYKPMPGYSSLDTTMTRNNSYLLPMIHLKANVTEWFDIRFAYTQTLSRPGYIRITPRSDTRWDQVSWNNYRLEPEHSENLDLYLSFKKDHLGLFTFGVFSKKIDKMIFDLGRRMIVDSTYIDDLPAEYINSKVIYTTANNAHTAYVKGVEIDWQTSFWYLPGVLKGLVLNVNYTHIFSDARYPYNVIENHAVNPWDPPVWVNTDTFYTARLIDQPDDVVNVQIGYDYKGFSARISMLYQARIFASADVWPELSALSDDYLRWDLSVKQELPWYGMQLFCNVNNITSATDVDLVRGSAWDSRIQHYGMTVDIGLRMKFKE